MKDIVKYVMGEAAKSNVEKRQVGCVITGHDLYKDKEVIIAKGYNTHEIHAEAMACEALIADAVEIKTFGNVTAFVSHQPCPACAQMLIDHGIHNVEVVESFMKFDSDKLRFDLIDGYFIQSLIGVKRDSPMSKADDVFYLTVKADLYAYAVAKDRQDFLSSLVSKYLIEFYGNYLELEKALAAILTFGASKYKPNNWRKCEDTGRYLAAAHRHLNALLRGEEVDAETHRHHMDHVMTNLMFLWVLGYDN